MQNNDQLTRNERIRLEALAQSNAYHTMKHATPTDVMEVARFFENFLRAADTDFKPQ